MSLSKHQERKLINALRTVRTQAVTGTIEEPLYGICYAMYCTLKPDVGACMQDTHDIMEHMYEHMSRWPDGTGSATTPIPSSYKHITADAQYHSAHNKWGGKQLKYRVALLTWLIDEHEGG